MLREGFKTREDAERWIRQLGFINPRLINNLVDNIITGVSHPFLIPEAIKFLETNIKDKTFLEFGSGFSTLYFSKFCKSHISVEHQYKWQLYLTAFEQIWGSSPNLSRIYSPIVWTKSPGNYTNSHVDYYMTPFQLPWKNYDVILIDGVYRLILFSNMSYMMHENSLLCMDNWDLWTKKSETYKEIVKYYELVDIITGFEESKDTTNEFIILKKKDEIPLSLINQCIVETAEMVTR